jgi:hypothetical protein
MATLSGTKIKDTFSLLLKMASSAASSSEQVVQDGAGNNTALKLSTDTVESTGEFKCTGTVSTSTTDVTALMLSSTGVFVQRNLSTNPIGTTSVTANSPVGATGSTIGLLAASSLSQLTEATAATADKFLIYDQSASAYKYITLVDLSDFVVNSGATVIPNLFVAKPQATTAIGTASLMISFAELFSASATGAVSEATSSVAFGGSSASISLVDATNIRDNIRLSSEAMYEITACVEYSVAAGTPDITTQLYINDGASSVTLIEDLQTAKVAKYTVNLRAYYYAPAVDIPVDIALRCSSTTAVTLTKNTTVTVTNLGSLSLPA